MLAALLPNLILITLVIASNHSEGLTSHYDPYISCWARPPTHQNGLPRTYPQSDYYNNLRLCSAAHGVPRRNVGCFCPASTSEVVCSENIADPELWSATISWYDHGAEHYDFPDWCTISCECITEGQAEAEHRGDINYYDSEYRRLRDMNGVLPGQPWIEPTSLSDTSSSGSNASDADAESSTTHTAVTAGMHDHDYDNDQSGNEAKIAVLRNQCGNACTSNNDCSPAAGNASCMCSTQSQQYQPSSGTVAFVAACIISLSGKRGESMPCPCNESYVSYACCGSTDGLVWEADDFKLGELVGEE